MLLLSILSARSLDSHPWATTPYLRDWTGSNSSNSRCLWLEWRARALEESRGTWRPLWCCGMVLSLFTRSARSLYSHLWATTPYLRDWTGPNSSNALHLWLKCRAKPPGTPIGRLSSQDITPWSTRELLLYARIRTGNVGALSGSVGWLYYNSPSPGSSLRNLSNINKSTPFRESNRSLIPLDPRHKHQGRPVYEQWHWLVEKPELRYASRVLENCAGKHSPSA